MSNNSLTLNMPANFAVLDETEMTYVVGGWSSKLFDNKQQAATFLADQAAMCTYFMIGVFSAAVVAAYFEHPVGSILSLGVDYVLNQWRVAYNEAANTARNLSWTKGVIVSKESYAGVIFIDFHHAPYVG